MKLKFQLNDLVLPLLLLAFVGVSVTFLGPFFTLTSRWAILLVAALHPVVRGYLWVALRSGFGLVTVLSVIWCAFTILWSEVPLLSVMKVGALSGVVFVCYASGYHWVRVHQTESTLNYLAPLTIAALLAGILGRFSAVAVVDTGGGSVLYQGLVGGPNMFGSMLAMCSPLLIWQTYQNWPRFKFRMLWLVLSMIGFYYLMAASSRGAIMVVLSTLLGFFLAQSLSRRVLIILFSVMGAIVFFVVAPGKLEQLQRQYIYKQGTIAQGVLYTREEVWQKTYEGAKKGAWIGGGYGVSIGSGGFSGGFTAENYGREKGNSQLAIVEETGIFGLIFYIASVILLFAKLIKYMLKLPKGSKRTLVGIVTGALLGMLIGSIFEAWWTSPGSPESVDFWALAGVGIGMVERGKAEMRKARQLSMSRQSLPASGAGLPQASPTAFS